MPIRQLPQTLINRIAAGEVVERPASIVKELVENALDAGARRIAITTAGGGADLIEVADDGFGMDEADLTLSVERHATSKLASDGLEAISFLGFRGEALASIGSVARLTIASRRAGGAPGLEIGVEHGRRRAIVPRAMNRGTIVTVRELFAHVPARLKFLKSERAEAAAITDIVKRLAMAHPEVHFTLEGSDRTSLNWPAVETGALAARLLQVLGDDFSANAAMLAGMRHGVIVTGLAGLPTFTKANGLSQFFFVNGRSVRDKVLVGAVRAAYADYVFRDRFPVVALYVAVEPQAVDVNVHPAKAELRFSDPGGVRSAVIRAIGEGLAGAGYRASTTVAADIASAFRAPEPDFAMAGQEDSPFSPEPRGLAEAGAAWDPGPAASRQASLYRVAPSAPRPADADSTPEGQEAFPLGVARAQVFENFVIAEGQNGLIMVDQHAAHERLVYERFKASLHAGPIAAQAQLIPIVVELSQDDCDRLEAVKGDLEQLGLGLERFGPRAMLVRETPALLGQTDATRLVTDLAEHLAEWESVASLPKRLDAIIARMACHGSVRAGRRLKPDEMNALLREMEATPHAGQCIHGRPTYVELKKADIERLFGRTR